MITRGKKIFWGLENVKGNFLLDKASVYEVEYPFRSCKSAWFIHVIPTKALVLGKWGKAAKDMQKHLLEAVQGELLDFQENKESFIY